MSNGMTTTAASTGCGCGGTTTSGGCGCGCGCGGACGCGTCCPPLAAMQRPRYFDGQLLTQSELTCDQAYVMAKNRLHNRYLHGWGVVCGLRVSCCNDTSVNVEAGYALDPCGNDIVLPQATTVPLLQMIQACRSQCQPSSQCNPFLGTTLEDCTGADQTWCLTIAYAEQDSRPVAALAGVTATGSACGCGCGCNGSSASKGSSTATDSAGQPATACQPTRTTETITFGVACMPVQPTTSTTVDRQGVVAVAQQTLAERLPAGTLIGQALAPEAALLLLSDEAPQPTGQNAQDDYTLVCRWLSRALASLGALPITTCSIATAFKQLTVRPPTAGEDPAEYLKDVLEPVLEQAQQLIQAAARDVLCWNLIPPCLPVPANACVVLACVTLRNDVIIDICMGAPRRQVVSFPALQYWMTDMPGDWVNQLPTFLSPSDFGAAVSAVCCGTENRAVPQPPSTAAAARFYALADLTTATPPAQTVTGLPPDEYAELRSSATELRTVAINALKQLQQ